MSAVHQRVYVIPKPSGIACGSRDRCVSARARSDAHINGPVYPRLAPFLVQDIRGVQGMRESGYTVKTYQHY